MDDFRVVRNGVYRGTRFTPFGKGAEKLIERHIEELEAKYTALIDRYNEIAEKVGFVIASFGLEVQEREKRIAELEAENKALRKAAQAHCEALQKWQYSQEPVPPLPVLAPTANALLKLLEGEK